MTYKPLLLSRTNRKEALEAFCVQLDRLEKAGWMPEHIFPDYTPAYEGGQRQQYIWQAILWKDTRDEDNRAANLSRVPSDAPQALRVDAPEPDAGGDTSRPGPEVAHVVPSNSSDSGNGVQ